MLLRIWKRIRASDTDPGEDEWCGGGHGAHASLDSGPGSRFGLGLVADGDVCGEEFLNGVQGLGRGVRELGRMWRGRMVCKGCRA